MVAVIFSGLFGIVVLRYCTSLFLYYSLLPLCCFCSSFLLIQKKESRTRRFHRDEWICERPEYFDEVVWKEYTRYREKVFGLFEDSCVQGRGEQGEQRQGHGQQQEQGQRECNELKYLWLPSTTVVTLTESKERILNRLVKMEEKM